MTLEEEIIGMTTIKKGKWLMGIAGVIGISASIGYISLSSPPVEAMGKMVYSKDVVHIYGKIDSAAGKPLPKIRVAMFREFDVKHHWKWRFVTGTFTNKYGKYDLVAPIHNPNGVRLEMFPKGNDHSVILHTWGLKKQTSGAFDVSVSNRFGVLAAQTFVY